MQSVIQSPENERRFFADAVTAVWMMLFYVTSEIGKWAVTPHSAATRLSWSQYCGFGEGDPHMRRVEACTVAPFVFRIAWSWEKPSWRVTREWARSKTAGRPRTRRGDFDDAHAIAADRPVGLLGERAQDFVGLVWCFGFLHLVVV